MQAEEGEVAEEAPGVEGPHEAPAEGLVGVGSQGQHAELHYGALEGVNPAENQMQSELTGWEGRGEEVEELSCLTVKRIKIMLQTSTKI